MPKKRRERYLEMQPSSDSLLRTASLEEDPYMPDLAFSDHIGNRNDHDHLISGSYFCKEHQKADYQRFSRIASAQEMEDFDSFYDASEEANDYNVTPDSGIHDISQDPEARAKAEEEWARELAQTEEEIQTLRQVLSSKLKKVQELKRKLGITVWKEFRDDMEQGIRNIQETTAYQRTSQTLKTASEKTSEALGSFSASVSKKLDEVKQSPTFKNIEGKVGSAYSNVKTKVVSGTSTAASGNETHSPSSENKNPADTS